MFSSSLENVLSFLFLYIFIVFFIPTSKHTISSFVLVSIYFNCEIIQIKLVFCIFISFHCNLFMNSISASQNLHWRYLNFFLHFCISSSLNLHWRCSNSFFHFCISTSFHLHHFTTHKLVHSHVSSIQNFLSFFNFYNSIPKFDSNLQYSPHQELKN
jgi:hypothetical protein